MMEFQKCWRARCFLILFFNFFFFFCLFVCLANDDERDGDDGGGIQKSEGLVGVACGVEWCWVGGSGGCVVLCCVAWIGMGCVVHGTV